MKQKLKPSYHFCNLIMFVHVWRYVLDSMASLLFPLLPLFFLLLSITMEFSTLIFVNSPLCPCSFYHKHISSTKSSFFLYCIFNHIKKSYFKYIVFCTTFLCERSIFLVFSLSYSFSLGNTSESACARFRSGILCFLGLLFSPFDAMRIHAQECM